MKSDFGKKARVGYSKKYAEAWDNLYGVVEVPLTQNKVAWVDKEDFDLVSKYIWCAHKGSGERWEAVAYDPKIKKQIKMHRLIMGLTKKDKVFVDHINHNCLNNRKSNLRIISNRRNQGNQKIKTGGTSEFKGVRWHKGNKKWEAQIQNNGKYEYIGNFDVEIDAAKAYDKRAIEIFGDCALLNFPLKKICPTCGGDGFLKEDIKCNICFDKGWHLDWNAVQKKFIKTKCLFCQEKRNE